MIERISPDNENYETLQEFVESPDRKFDYDEFTEQYNDAAVGEILVFEYSGSVIGNFIKMLTRRGIVRREDYNCKSTQARAGESGTYRVVIKKLTEVECNNF